MKDLDVAWILLVIAGICFVLEALGLSLGRFNPKWWALGVAFYLFSLAA